MQRSVYFNVSSFCVSSFVMYSIWYILTNRWKFVLSVYVIGVLRSILHSKMYRVNADSRNTHKNCTKYKLRNQAPIGILCLCAGKSPYHSFIVQSPHVMSVGNLTGLSYYWLSTMVDFAAFIEPYHRSIKYSLFYAIRTQHNYVNIHVLSS